MPSTLDADVVPPPALVAEHVVLLDPHGVPTGTCPKAEAHHAATPFHLAFSAYLVGPDGRVLLTRRSGAKRTWPGVWTNACCGHPQWGETLRGAVTRRAAQELGLVVTDVTLALPDFAYRAVMDDGTVEHELCPVVVARVDGTPTPDPDEVDDWAWTTWPDLLARATRHPGSLSPWSVAQIAQFAALGLDPTLRPTTPPGRDRALDRPVGAVPARPAAAVAADDPVAEAVVPVEAVLRGFLAEQAAALAAVDPALVEVTDEVAALVWAGGKRIRPAFVHWGHVAAGGRPGGAAAAGASVELLHTFALLHDDVMDRSELRRGRPAAHVGLADRHRDWAGRGDPAWFGASAAVLAGDLVHVWADEVLHRAEAAPEALGRARAVYDDLRREVIAGQYLDLRLAATGDDPAAARLVTLLKTARYTVTRPLLLGAELAEPAPGAAVRRALAAYGDAVGMAFQLRDDVLGLVGDPGATGKGDLDDLREGKRTLLVLLALRLAPGTDAAVLDAALGDPDLDHPGADAARAVVLRSGALASVERLIAALHDDALAALDDLPARVRGPLAELAGLAVDRAA